MKLPSIQDAKEAMYMRQQLAKKIENMPDGHSLFVEDELMAIAFKEIWVIKEAEWKEHPWSRPPVVYITSEVLLNEFCEENSVTYHRENNRTVFTKKESE